MPDIFVSYAHADRDQIRTLVDALGAQGWSVYWDDAIRTGKWFDRELDEALNATRCVVVAWSENAVKSNWVLTEAQFGLDHSKLIPVRLDGVALPAPFDLVQTANLTGWPHEANREPDLQRLLRDIATLLGTRQPNFGADMSRPVPGFDGRAAVAVLPFEMLSSEPGQDYLADGICEDIITHLQRFRTFPVIARHSSFAFRGSTIDHRRIASELGVGYLVSGSIRKQSRMVRINVDLIDAATLHSVWSESYQRTTDEVLDLQETISIEIVARLEPEIERAERRRAPVGQPVQPGVWHLIRRGLWHQYRLTRDDAVAARRYFDQALLRDPNSVEALVQLGWWEWLDRATRRATREEWNVVRELAQRALRIDPDDARAVCLLGTAATMQGKHQSGRELYLDAIDLNPSYAQAYSHLGTTHSLMGDPDQATAPLQKSMRLSPFDLFVFHAFGELAMAHFMIEHWAEAIEAADHSLRVRPGYWLAHVVKVASLARAGRSADAATAVATLTAHRPNLSAKDVNWIMFADPRWNTRILGALELAGWSPR